MLWTVLNTYPPPGEKISSRRVTCSFIYTSVDERPQSRDLSKWLYRNVGLLGVVFFLQRSFQWR